MDVLNKETLRNTLEHQVPNARHENELWRMLGWMEANLIQLGVMEIGKPLPYGENESYKELIIRLAEETLK